MCRPCAAWSPGSRRSCPEAGSSDSAQRRCRRARADNNDVKPFAGHGGNRLLASNILARQQANICRARSQWRPMHTGMTVAHFLHLAEPAEIGRQRVPPNVSQTVIRLDDFCGQQKVDRRGRPDAVRPMERSMALQILSRAVLLRLLLGRPALVRAGPVGQSPANSSLDAIARWISANYDLPYAAEMPRGSNWSQPAQIHRLRYNALLPRRSQAIGGEHSTPLPEIEREVVAVYDDTSRTIYRPAGLTGACRAAERSVLVHEMVHHLQNLAGREIRLRRRPRKNGLSGATPMACGAWARPRDRISGRHVHHRRNVRLTCFNRRRHGIRIAF